MTAGEPTGPLASKTKEEAQGSVSTPTLDAPPSAAPTTSQGFFGIDGAVFYTLAGRAAQFLGAAVTSIVLILTLSKEQQGFFFTFASILMTRGFFEIGVSYVVFQFASHEKAHLRWTPQGILAGDPVAKARLSLIFRRGVKWYGLIVLVTTGILIPAGFYFLDLQGQMEPVSWRGPWLSLVLASGISFLLVPAFAVLEGCGKVKEVALARLGLTVVNHGALCAALFLGGGLYAPGIAAVFYAAWQAGWLLGRNRTALKDLLTSEASAEVFSWRKEAWSFQWRIAVGTICGYFVFYFYAPVAFRTHGAALAGQVGMSVSIVLAITLAAMGWMMTKAPRFGELIARREYRKLDTLFRRSLFQTTAFVAAAGLAFWGAAMYLHRTAHPWSDRLLDPLALSLLVVTLLPNHIVNCQAVYLRAHKKEPLTVALVLTAVAAIAGTLLLAPRWGGGGMMSVLLGVHLVILFPLATLAFLRKRTAWRASAEVAHHQRS